MQRGARIGVSILLILVGLAGALFFGALLGIADCTQACIERGERAPVYAFIGAGLGLVGAGLLWKRSGMQAFGTGFALGGAIGATGAAYSMMQGARGAMVWVTLVVGVGCLAVGLWLLRRWKD